MSTGMPRTERGLSSPYAGLPVHMAGRALAVWFRLADPAEARRHVPDVFTLDDDPVLGARFWELTTAPGTTTFCEATVAFPVAHGGARGDNTVHMYADDASYVTFARELMGWPVRPGTIRVTRPWPHPDPTPGAHLAGALERTGRTVMEVGITLTGRVPDADLPAAPPTWLTEKLIPDVAGGDPVVHQVVRTGPDRMRWGPVWDATGTLSFAPSAVDELHHLAPREVVRAQYWSDVELWLGPGEVLTDLRSGTA